MQKLYIYDIFYHVFSCVVCTKSKEANPVVPHPGTFEACKAKVTNFYEDKTNMTECSRSGNRQNQTERDSCFQIFAYFCAFDLVP